MDDNLSETKTLHCLESYPFLVYPYGRRGKKKHILCSLSQAHKIYRKSIPELSGYTQIVARCSNWLLLSHTYIRYSLWNPTTSESIRLPPPPLEHSQSLSCYILLAPPGDPNCMVLLFFRSSSQVLFIRPEAGDKEWTLSYYGESLDDGIENVCLSPSVNCNVELYALSYRERRLVRVSVDRTGQILVESLQCELSNTPISIISKKQLVESGGEIYYISISRRDSWNAIIVMVFKLDISGMVWTKVESLMGRVIFLDESAFSCSAMGKGVICDSIYFTIETFEGKIIGRDQALYSFNVRDGQLLDALPCPNLPEPWKSPMFLMMPWLRNDHEQVQIRFSEENKSSEESNGIDKKKDTLRETGEAATVTRFSDLPLDILNSISDCLNLFDYLSFHAACWDCSSVAPQLQGKQSSSRLKSTPISPLLIFPNNDTSILNIIEPRHPTKFLKIPESLVGHRPLYSKDGWLLMSDCKESVSFYNVFTNEVINLPTPPEGYLGTLNSMWFSSSPTSWDCVVAVFICRLPGGVLYTTMGRQQWDVCRCSGWYPCALNHCLHYSSPVFYNGAFYLLGEAGKLFVFNMHINGRELECKYLYLERFYKCSPQGYLLKWNGKLVSIFVGQIGNSVEVYMFDSNTRNWEKVENLGNYMFYVSRSSCVALRAVTTDMKNKIFFSRFLGSDILYYSLDTRRFYSDGHDSFENFYNAKEQVFAGWMNLGY